MKTNDSITTKLLPKDVLEKNKVALDVVDYYSKVSDIVDRTYAALGKKTSYKISNSSTINQKLNINAFITTH